MCNRCQLVLLPQETLAKVQIPLQDHSILITDHIPVFGTQNSRICEKRSSAANCFTSRFEVCVSCIIHTRVYLDININQQTHETPQLSYTQNDICVCTYTHTKIYFKNVRICDICILSVLNISLSLSICIIQIPNILHL